MYAGMLVRSAIRGVILAYWWHTLMPEIRPDEILERVPSQNNKNSTLDIEPIEAIPCSGNPVARQFGDNGDLSVLFWQHSDCRRV